jgi:hypothetical protein
VGISQTAVVLTKYSIRAPIGRSRLILGFVESQTKSSFLRLTGGAGTFGQGKTLGFFCGFLINLKLLETKRLAGTAPRSAFSSESAVYHKHPKRPLITSLILRICVSEACRLMPVSSLATVRTDFLVGSGIQRVNCAMDFVKIVREC